jgi:hypothetical protein
MRLVIPATSLEIGRVHLSPFEKRNGEEKLIAPLSYNDTYFKMKDIEIMTPVLTIDSYNASAGHIRCLAPISGPGSKSAVSIFATKLNMLQEYIISTLHLHQSSILGRTDLERDIISRCFQKLFVDNYINIYIAQNDIRTPIFKKDDMKPSFGLMKHFTNNDAKGIKIRIILKISGLRVLHGTPYRFRLHHTLMGVYIVD